MINLRSALLNKVINSSTKFLLENDSNRNKNEKKRLSSHLATLQLCLGRVF